MATTATLPRPGQSAAEAEPDFPYEVVDGKIVEVPPMGSKAGMLATELAIVLGSYVRAKGLGSIACEVLFVLDPSHDLRRRGAMAGRA